MKHLVVGIDTSCYTTSVACVSTEGIVFEKRTVLSVPMGTRGLRQSEAVFAHVRGLPPLIHEMFSALEGEHVRAVCVSTKPTDAPESYMPVFLAGKLAAASIADALQVPLHESTHQAGHVRAALMGNDALKVHKAILALHLSGGTTDVLRVSLSKGCIRSVEAVGGSDDLHAGQFVDRVGVRMGLPFPSGQSLEKLASKAARKDIRLSASVQGLRCSFSGPETQAVRLWDEGEVTEEVAYAVYDCLSRTIAKLIQNAIEACGDLPVLLSGGVSGSGLLRTLLAERLNNRPLYFAPEGLSADNAVGAALLGLDAELANQGSLNG